MIRGNNFRFGAGYTDLLLELKKQPDEELTIINLAKLQDEQFIFISHGDEGIRIGAMVTAVKIISDKKLQKQYPVLFKAANSLASRQIRQVATVGGNLCTASPAGDIACALVALEAKCEILSTDGSIRVIPIQNFFVDVRETVLQKNEVLRSVLVPSFQKQNEQVGGIYSDFIKIGTRRSMECSVVSLAYHVQADKNNIVLSAGIAIGSAAPTIKFINSACNFLIGKDFSKLSEEEKEEFAGKVLEYASPISDIRASAWYRKEVLFNVSKSIFLG
ncbi:MAG: FAD binding domain-containing protein [Bacteroidota bacterium]